MAATAMVGLHSAASLSLPRHHGLRSAPSRSASLSGSAKLHAFARPSCRASRAIRASSDQSPQGSSVTNQPAIAETSEASEVLTASCTRRSAILAGLVATTCGEAGAQLLASPLSAAAAEAAAAAIAADSQSVIFSTQQDVINACAYDYPLKLADPVGSIVWIETRKPERYSSAAPLSPDARLRIVSERLVPIRSLVITVSVSPPNPAFLPSPPPPATDLEAGKASGWTAVNVARSILADRTSPRMTSIQRLQETILGDAYEELRTADGATQPIKYYLFEYVNQKSPTMLTGRSKDVFRRSLSVAAEREGYIYCLTVSTVDSEWPQLEDALRTTVESFRLTEPTGEYVPPWKDPWWFW
ncbi:hypothetical protein CLOM_g14952 [Closterium sp. NIES-68]|nr:hypothetical protein CLOM_g14952 [Closterium sp. NIES-68]GJP70095.1 hypothetical protein CLOP_g1080 [Closterium sp. NIES-67]